jgi:hypothetical protein
MIMVQKDEFTDGNVPGYLISLGKLDFEAVFVLF